MGGSVPAVPGVKAEQPLLSSFRQEVATLLGRDSIAFPGAQPVSFAAKHLLELQKQDYYVCEKSDGIRCLMYLTNDGPREVTYLIDRKNEYYYVPGLHFPLPGEDQLFHIGTLIDGELVNDKLPNGTIQMKYLVFDCMVLEGTNLMPRTLDKRLAYFRDKVYNPYQALYKKYPEEIQYLPFIVEFKSMQLSYGIEMMFRDVLPHLPHGNDGLIFTCKNTPYKCGTDEHILKWKDEKDNSVDFVLSFDWPTLSPDSEDECEGRTSPFPDYSSMPAFNLKVNGGGNDYIQYGTMHVEPQEWEDLKALGEPLDERIVECVQDKQNRWRFLRFRDDKKDANHISTVQSVMESIQDKISEMDLISNAKKIRDEWKKRQAIDEARAKQEATARKAQGSSNGIHQQVTTAQVQHGITSDGHSGIKRKLGDATNGDESVRRRATPQPET